MPQLTFAAQARTNQSILDFGITDIVVHDTAEGPVLYTTSGPNGGVAAYRIDANGDLGLLDFAHFDNGWSEDVLANLTILNTVNGPQLVVAGDAESDLMAFDLGADGSIQGFGTLSGLTADSPAVLAVDQFGTDMVFLANGGDGAIQGYALQPDNALQAQFAISDTQTTYADTVFALETMSVNDADFLISASQTEQGVTAFRIDGDSLVAKGSLGIAEGIGIMTPTALETVEINGRYFVLLGSSPADGQGQSGAITVMELMRDGKLVPTDHVIDTLHTRFGNLQSLEVIEADGRTYVIAAGGDDGLTAFTLLPNGRLQVLDVMPDMLSDNLDNVSALAAFRDGDGLSIFVSSELNSGVTEVTLDTTRNGNVLSAADGGQALDGSALDDILIGGRGNDALDASYGDDILEDGAGRDTLTGGGGRDIFVLRADGDADIIADFEYNRDKLDLSDWPFLYDATHLTVTSTAFGAILTWRGETLEVQTRNGTSLTAAQIHASVFDAPNRVPFLPEDFFDDPNEQQDGTGGNDTLDGEDGNDTINGMGGADSILGGAGDDVLTGGTGRDTLLGGRGTDSIDGGDDADSIRGGADDDTLHGGRGHDTIFGEDDRDLIHGGDGFDFIRGGSDNDLIHGGAQPDNLGGDNGNDTIHGGQGIDLLYGGFGDDDLRGGTDADRLFGQVGNDRLFGDTGNDSLYGGNGFDFIRGGNNDDLIHGGAQPDNLGGDNGNDTIYGGQGIDQLYGGFGDDRLHGGTDADRLFGQDGNDRLFGDNGHDLMNGGDGDDVLHGQFGHDTLHGGNGDDTLTGFYGYDYLRGDGGNDVIYGGALADNLGGGNGNDTLLGGQGNDLLFGGFGNDRLEGGADNDALWGGPGSDTFVFANGHGDDTVKDFNADSPWEKLDFTGHPSLNALWDILGPDGAARQDGANVRIDTGGGSVLWLMGVDLGDLDASDFIF